MTIKELEQLAEKEYNKSGWIYGEDSIIQGFLKALEMTGNLHLVEDRTPEYLTNYLK